MQYIGKIDREKMGEFKYTMVTNDVVLTEERRLHIYEHHTKDYTEIMKAISIIVLNPNEILEDIKNRDTVFFIGKLRKT